jgi:hypothetical protein
MPASFRDTTRKADMAVADEMEIVFLERHRRPREIAALHPKMGEKATGLMPIAAVVWGRGIHVCLLHESQN